MGYPDQVRAVLDSAIAGMAESAAEWVARPGRDFTRERLLTFPKVMGMLVSMGPDAIGVEVAREFVNDRGIASYNVYAHAVEAGAFFLVRLYDRKASRILGRDVSGEGPFDEVASLMLSRSKSKRKMLRPDREGDYRHVAADVPLDYITEESPEYEIALRVVRLPIGEGGPENVVANLPAGPFGAEDLRDLYWMRWGIETSFRDLKHTVGAAAPHSSRPPLVAMEVWARMVLYNFGSVVAAHVVEGIGPKRGRKHWRRANLAFTLKACHDFLRMDALARPPDIEGLIRRSTLPVKPGRRYERRLRFQVPPAFMYRFS